MTEKTPKSNTKNHGNQKITHTHTEKNLIFGCWFFFVFSFSREIRNVITVVVVIDDDDDDKYMNATNQQQ